MMMRSRLYALNVVKGTATYPSGTSSANPGGSITYFAPSPWLWSVLPTLSIGSFQALINVPYSACSVAGGRSTTTGPSLRFTKNMT